MADGPQPGLDGFFQRLPAGVEGVQALLRVSEFHGVEFHDFVVFGQF